jgi:hypothetical protein
MSTTEPADAYHAPMLTSSEKGIRAKVGKIGHEILLIP